ncbi:MAG TPA: four helix bundle protein [Fimbriimonadaceae bacterium]|jgi:four helix bundle protein
MAHFSEDEAWKLSKDLAVFCYQNLTSPDKENTQNLDVIIKRSALQVSENVAQDFGSKAGVTGRIQLNMAVKGLQRLESNLLIALELNAISREFFDSTIPKIRDLGAVLKERRKLAQTEMKSKMAERMSGLGFEVDDD